MRLRAQPQKAQPQADSRGVVANLNRKALRDSETRIGIEMQRLTITSNSGEQAIAFDRELNQEVAQP
jgi:hypothetical protein